jgi:hypothetical protein
MWDCSLKPEKFKAYNDGGLGTPFDAEQLMRFCVDHQHLFGIKNLVLPGVADDKGCEYCGDENATWVYNVLNFEDFYEDDECTVNPIYERACEYIDDFDLETIEDHITVYVCQSCGSWIVTH